MSKLLKLAGIYNQDLIQLGVEREVYHLGFDFRPRSPNFLQEYAFKDLIEKNFDHRMKFYLHYQDEKDFMIKRMAEQINESLQKIGREKEFLNNFYLQLSDVRELSFYKSLPLKFIWEYHPLGDIHRILSLENNSGLCLPYGLVREAKEKGELEELVMKILRAKQNRAQGNDFQITLQMDWDSDPMFSLSEFLDIDMIELPINNMVETSYRNIDVSRITSGLNDFKKVTFQNI